MTTPHRSLIVPLIACVLLGVGVDFLFNGILVGFLFNRPLGQGWGVIYVPIYFAAAMTLSTLILRTRWQHFNVHAVVAFLAGATLGHWALVGAHRARIYFMNLDADYGSVLLRSDQWPQVLFVSSARVREEMAQRYARQPVPVVVEVVSDYGCDRTAVVSTVAGVDVRFDREATWTWQIDRQSAAAAAMEHGPGTEDQGLPWCKRPPAPRVLEDSPGLRPWEEHGQKRPTVPSLDAGSPDAASPLNLRNTL